MICPSFEIHDSSSKLATACKSALYISVKTFELSHLENYCNQISFQTKFVVKHVSYSKSIT
jgi:hypothetical protein